MSQTTGMTGNADKPLLRLNDRQWFNRLGQVAKSIGSREFHHELVDLFGASIRHEFVLDYSLLARRGAGSAIHAQCGRRGRQHL